MQDLNTEIAINQAFANGKSTTLEVLRQVLDSMKSVDSNPTSNIVNRILDEIYERVEVEIL